MPVSGDLRTMPLFELLQWAAANEKTGVLELERNKIRKQICFREGRIVGCSSNDPSTRFGQFLISRGKISERTLQFALEQQKASGRKLPDLLVDMGVIRREEVTEQISNKALETIFGMFEWDDAIFRFQLGAAPDRYNIEVELSVEAILLDGAQRQDELGRFRGVFTSSGVVLRQTDRPIPSQIEDGSLVFRILELVDGRRALAEILVRAHASEYAVLKALFVLQQAGNIEIASERQLDGTARTLIDVRNDDTPIPLPSIDQFQDAAGEATDDAGVTSDEEWIEDPSVVGVVADLPQATPAAPPDSPIESTDLPVLLQVAKQRTERGDYESALTILDACYAARPHDESLKKQMERTEAAYLSHVRDGVLRPDLVPLLTLGIEELAEPLPPAQMTLLGMIDGGTSIESILWLAPLSELQVLRSLHQLYDKGLIHFSDGPATGDAGVAPEEEPAVGLDLPGGPAG